MSPQNLTPTAKGYKQCQNCWKSENEPGIKLLSCSKCSRAHYCGKECQVADWPKHKIPCRVNANTLGRIKGDERQAETVDRKVVEERLKKWIQVHRPLLNITLINALDLKEHPEKCLESLLILVIDTNFTKETAKIAARFFKINRTEVAPFSEARQLIVEQLGPGSDAAFDNVLAQSKELRSKGGVGVGLMLIIVPQAGILHVTPFGMPELLIKAQTKKDRLIDSQWEEKLIMMVEMGKVI